MAKDGYELLALFMRYVFVALGALVLLRSFLWLRKDARAYRKEIKNLPDAGLVGEMVDMHTGQSYPLPREGVLGAARSCDVRIRHGLCAGRHLNFLFVEGKGLAITPVGRESVYLDGEAVQGTGYALHGTQVEAGGVTLRVRLFAGLKVPRRVLYHEDEYEEALNGPSPFEEVAGLFAPGDEYGAPVDEYGAVPYDEPMNSPYPDAYGDPYAQPDPGQDDGQMLWQHAPIPPDEAQEEPEADEDEYTPPFAAPVRKRRSDRYL